MFDNYYTGAYKNLSVSSKIYSYDKINKKFSVGDEAYLKVGGKINCFFMHNHDAIEILYIRKGKLSCEVNGKKITAFSGDILFFNPYEAHHGYMEDDVDFVEYQCICADLPMLFLEKGGAAGNIIVGIYESQTACDNLIKKAEPCSRSLAACIESIGSSYDEQNIKTGVESCIIGSFYTFFGILAGNGHIDRCDGRKRVNRYFVSDILAYIDDNYSQNITAEMLSAAFSYNPSYFCRIFKQNFNSTFHNYLCEYRLRRAQSDWSALFANGTVNSIHELAEHVGFSDYCYFSRAFKKYTGISPKEYFKREN